MRDCFTRCWLLNQTRSFQISEEILGKDGSFLLLRKYNPGSS